jgi:hypothetical protein
MCIAPTINYYLLYYIMFYDNSVFYDILVNFKVLIMITISETKFNEISLKFISIYLILWLKLYSFLECYISCDLNMA